MDVPPPIAGRAASDLESLLGEDRWIRRLARRLVADASTAEDLVQETYLTALASEAKPRDPRAWLAGIARNLWRDLARSGARRERREARAARPEATASTDELVAEVELRKHVAELVLALEEPLRRALILRFFQGRSLAEVAEVEGVSVSTVHERVERGLARLRTRLDAEHGGERRAWAVGLAALARLGVAPAWTGGLLMGTTGKLAVAVLVLGALGWLVVGNDPWRGGVGAAPGAAEPALASAEAAAPLAREALRESAATGPAVTSAGSSSAGSARLEAGVHGRVLALDGSPLAGIPVGLLVQPFEEEPAHGPQTTSAADGSFALALPAGGELVRPVDLDPARILLAVEERQLEGGESEWRLTLTGASAYAGVVVDEDGAPIEGAEARVELHSAYLREHGYVRLMDMQPEWKATSDALGRFALPAAPAGEAVVLRVESTGFQPAEVSAQGEELSLRVVLRRGPDDVPITGIVLGPEGDPVAGAQVATMFQAATSAADGTFTVLWHSTKTHTIGLPDGSRMRRTERHLTTTKEGLRPAHVAIAELDLTAPVVLRLEPELGIAGRVVDARGEALENVRIWVSDPTPLGTFVDGSATQCAPLSVESFGGSEPGCRSDADGRFELRQLLAREYQVMVFDPRTASFGGPWLLAAGSGGVTLVLDAEPGVRVAGRMVTADGEPLGEGLVLLQRVGPGGLVFNGNEVTTDAAGAFEFPSVVLAGTKLTCFHPSFFVHSVALEGLADPAHLELVAPRLCEVQIELADPGLADHARFHDGDGHELAALAFDSSSVSLLAELALPRGRSDVVQVADTARMLVLYQAGQEVLRVPMQPDPAQRTVLRP
jgi:RNA polymerase sigma factor (sigma-70 family)